MLLWTNNN